MPDSDDPYALTPEEQKLLDEHMQFYHDLETGHRQPETQAQKHFVRMTLGQAVAETPHEMAYAKYMRKRAQQHAAESHESRDPSEGPTEEWGDREAWKQMRGREYGFWRGRTRGD